jgi:ketosteroid isomerase-like protein
MVTGVQRHKVFVDGDDVCVIYDLNTVPVPRSPTAEWYRVRAGKIASIRVFFDARPFAESADRRQQ